MGYFNADEARYAELQSLLDKNKLTSKKKKKGFFQSFASDYAPIREEHRIESNTIESGNLLTNGEIAALNKAKSKKNASAYDYRDTTESILKNQLGRSADSIVDSALKGGWYDALKLSLDDSVAHPDNKSINQKWKKQLQESVSKIEFFNAVASKNGGTLPENVRKNMDYLKTKSSDELQFMFNQMYPSEKKSGMDTSASATLSSLERRRKSQEYNLSDTDKTAAAILNAVPSGMVNGAKGIENSLNLILSGEAAKTVYNKVTSDVNNFKQSQVKMTDEQKEEYAKRKLSEEIEALHNGTYADYSAKQKKAMAELFRSSDDSALTESGILRKRAENAAKYPILAEYENVTAPNVQNNKAAQIASSLVFSGANMLPSIAANMVLPGSGTAVVGLSSGGNAYEQALLEGKTKEQALGYGVLIGTSEALTEKLLGGIKAVGGKGAAKILSKLSKDTANKVIKAVKKVAESKAGSYLLSGLAEANEEWVQANLEPIFRNIMFDENNEIKPFSEDKLEAALLGFLNASVLNAPYLFSKSNTANNTNVTKAFNTAADSKTAGNVFTDSEQAVLDKVYEKAVAERETDGSKLTDKEKSKLYDAIAQQMEKGGIDIDTIESTLGGDAYKAYKDTVDSEEKLKKELNELSNTETGKLTRNQLKRLEQLESMNLDDTAKRDSLRKQLDDTLSPLLENSRLAESYNQAERRKQAFQADLTQYKGKQRAAVERAINSGVLNDTYRSHELVDILSKIEADKGISFAYTNNAKLKESGFAIEGKTVNGYVTKNGVTLNVQSSKAWQSVVGHEITHVLEGTDAYIGLRSALYAYAESKGEFASRLAELTELYKGIDADVDAELTAELVGDYLFSDKDFINHLTENRTIFRKIYDEIKYLCKVATGKELTDIEKVKREFDKAWKEVSGKGVDGKVKYSIQTDSNGKKYVNVDTDQHIFDGVDPRQYSKIANQYILDHFRGKVIGDTNKAYVNKRTAEEFSHPANRRITQDVRNSKMKSSTELDNLMSASELIEHTNDDGRHPDATGGWDWYSVDFVVDGQPFNGTISVKNTDNGRIFYDMTKIRSLNDRKGDLSGKPLHVASVDKTSINPTIPQEQSGVNTSIPENAENDTKNSQFSLSKNGEQPPIVGTPLNDMYFDAPVREDIAQILTETPEQGKKKSRIVSKVRSNFIDKGSAVEDLALKTKNRALQDKYKTIGRSEAKAQYFMENGADGVKSLKDIRQEVEQSGKVKEFFTYLYHKHNVDRMSLESKEAPNLARLTEKMRKYKLLDLKENQLRAIAMENVSKDNPKRAELVQTVRDYLASTEIKNKPVFGDSVTAEASQETASRLEKQYPQFKQYANDVYSYMNHLRDMMVESGIITNKTADLWGKMYPSYVPIGRDGKNGLAVDVPLDTNRTGVDAPIHGAKGGNSDILPLFDTMAQRTIQTFKAIDKNNFGIELKNTLGGTFQASQAKLDEVIDTIDTQNGLLQKGENGKNPTFTVFENGKRVTFDITDDLYDVMKPTSEGLSYTNKALNKASSLHKKVLTEYNLFFTARNALKDAQDVLINSQHPAKTYANFPQAFNELWKGKGEYVNEYWENGGKQNTYFDKSTNSFTEEKSKFKKIVGLPLEGISKANDFVEALPRLAEYIASRKKGATVEAAMLDAARVTTDFSAGGDVTKFLNRNGATFLNASVQGAAQQVRNIREAKANGLKGIVKLAGKYALAGLPALLLNSLIWGKDEEYEELSDYVKENYYIVGKYGDGQFVRIPKGRTLSVIQELFEQIGKTASGEETDWGNVFTLAASNLAPNNPIDNNVIAPIVQAATNKTWYGEDLVPKRLQDVPAREQYDETIDSISKWLGENTGISPYKINYVLNQYTGFIGDIFLPALTPEAERGNDSFAGNLIAPLTDQFTVDKTIKNQNPSDFFSKADELKVKANSQAATDEDILKSKYMSAVNSEMSDLYKQKREIQNLPLKDSAKYAQVRSIQEKINVLAKNGLSMCNNINIDNGYATVGDKHYRKNDDGVWTRISDKQLERQQEVTSKLGISPSEYWGKTKISYFPNSDGEYEYAYDNPEKYAVAKSVGGYEAYKSYKKDLYGIKSDKDTNGKSISGSRKEKVIDYINNLDADYETKLILFKSEYPSDDTYNAEIVEYLNNREDVSYNEMVDILTELGFTVTDDGIVKWD